MMLDAVQQTGRGRKARFINVPAPVKGWHTGALYQDMGPEYAAELQNLIPERDKVTLRRGLASHATGLPDAVESLMEYSYGATSSLWAASGTAIYNVTSPGAVGAAAVSGLANARFQHTMFSTTGGNFLICVNGANGVRTYSGGAWATQTVLDAGSNAVSTNFLDVTSHKERLWFIERNTLSAWYFPPLAISTSAMAPAVELDVSSLCDKGGSLVAIKTWSRDGGAGMDDLLVMLTSEGEVLIYEGTDPDSASTWQLVGVFQVSRPIGSRCICPFGADLLIFTQAGPQPLSEALSTSVPQVSVPAAIRDQFYNATVTASSFYGWEIINYAPRGWVFCNIPADNGSFSQYVLNAVTGGWFRITGWNGNCFEIAGNQLYMGGDTIVYEADTGLDDAGSPIAWRWMTTASFIAEPGEKIAVAARPRQLSSAMANPSIRALFDGDIGGNGTGVSVTGAGGSAWGSPWGSPWGASSSPVNLWSGVEGMGQKIALDMQMSCTDTTLAITGVDFQYHQGAPVF
jgi:hypothetical protein